jgi:hypothetical protein
MRMILGMALLPLVVFATLTVMVAIYRATMTRGEAWWAFPLYMTAELSCGAAGIFGLLAVFATFIAA